jgi:hypothetical protein
MLQGVVIGSDQHMGTTSADVTRAHNEALSSTAAAAAAAAAEYPINGLNLTLVCHRRNSLTL